MAHAQKVAALSELSSKVSRVFKKRAATAKEEYESRQREAGERLRTALAEAGSAASTDPFAPVKYAADFAQRTILFWDTLRQRGNDYVANVKAGQPPVLHFEYEMEIDGRTFARPVNYALVKILPPEGVKIDTNSRPYVIIDPRAGHGPGIGGFKDDSQVGVALRAGHPVYFVIFFTSPEPGQTLDDVCEAERQFVKRVRKLHPAAPKPAIVGNCQGGWAAMMLAAANPDDTGPLVINGAPMSYWGGAWTEGEGDNPMRYAGGMLGGSWLASLVSDLGAGKFDGAWLVQNFENLNPANTIWDKPYHLFSNIDTEPARFLEFERWWGGFYLMNTEEIEWITQNLFVGNKLFADEKGGGRALFDLREIKVPIVLFASMGDNITPPQQAFNWVADVYKSTDEIKARGQVIVGLLHQDVGHLGIFVSGKVAKREHTQIVHVLRSIESLAPGLYAMHVDEQKDAKGKVTYEVSFVEHRLEDLVKRMNRFKRVDEKPFEAVRDVSEFNQRAYELFVRPVIKPLASEPVAKGMRALHPLRSQRWMTSDMNPFLWWLAPAANAVRANRSAVEADAPTRRVEKALSDMTSASLDYYRAMRDAVSESMFFTVYGSMFASQLGDAAPPEHAPEPETPPVVREALDSVERGGYPEAVARVAYLTSAKGRPLPLSTLALKQELLKDFRDLLPQQPADEARRTRGVQEIIVRADPKRALATLPKLVPDRASRDRLLRLIDAVSDDDRVEFDLTSEQQAMIERIRGVLAPGKPAKRKPVAKAPAPRKPAKRKPVAKAPTPRKPAKRKGVAKPSASRKPAKRGRASKSN